MRGSVFIDEQFANDTNLTFSFLPLHASRLISSFPPVFATISIGLQAPILVVYYDLIGIRSLSRDFVILQLREISDATVRRPTLDNYSWRGLS